MSPRNKRLLIHASRRGLVLWKQDGTLATELVRHPFQVGTEGSTELEESQLSTGLAALTSTISAEFARQHVEVILDNVFSPGLSVDLGDSILPARVRRVFIHSRFKSVVQGAGDDWEMRTDSSWITGAVLSFAVKPSIRTILEDGLANLRVRSISIQPTWAWCWHQHPAPKLTGLFISGSEDEMTVVYMRRGRPLSIDATARGVSSCNGKTELDRLMLVHGFLDDPREIKIIGLPGVSLPNQFKSQNLTVETFSAAEVRP